MRILEYTTIIPQNVKFGNMWGMGCADTPRVIPIELMQSMQSGCGWNDQVLPPKIFELGNVVRVANGPFKDVIAKVENFSNSNRIAVFLDLIGRTTRVEIRRENLEIAAA